MASVLKVNTLTGVTTAGSIVVTGEGNSTTTNLQQGLAKAWLQHNSSHAIQDSFNFASITDNSTGNYTLNYSNDFNNAFYSVTLGNQKSSSTAIVDYISSSKAAGVTTLRALRTNDASDDVTDFSSTAHGDLA